ncbi:hypothetical protein TWF694_004520 [Orbilia ellipsospora]|uniref:Acyltransferase PapA5 n=1 Tax=Orbilia ellipsospora TaxID=2528407 RepID=A0AAV9WWH3_9PEZI
MNAEKYWTKTGPGKWERNYDPVEKFLHETSILSPHMVQLTIAIGAILPKEISVEAIKTAWLALRYMHPSIACTIQDTGLSYQVPTEKDLQRWLEETVHVNPSRKPGRELAMSLEPPSSSRVVFLPNQREVFFQLRHELIDGVGSTKLLNQFIKYLSEDTRLPTPKFGDETSRLSPSLTQIMNAENPPPEVLDQARQIAEKYFSTPPLGLKIEQPDVASVKPRVSSLYEHLFSENETTSITQACKRKGHTVTQAITAAAALAILEHSGQECGNFSPFFIANLRDKVPAPYNESMTGIYVTPGLGSIPVTKNSSFFELSEAAREEYEWKHNKNNVASHGPIGQAIEGALTMASTSGITIPAGVTISSLGLVESYLTEPVEDFWINLVSATYYHSGFFVYTAKNRLRLSYCYNDAFFTKDCIKRYVDMLVNHLERGLDIA